MVFRAVNLPRDCRIGNDSTISVATVLSQSTYLLTSLAAIEGFRSCDDEKLDAASNSPGKK
jgi:hypothetical protein